MASEGQADDRRSIASVTKGTPTKLALGATNTPMLAGYRQADMDVIVRGSG